MSELTAAEKRWVASLKRVMRNRPKTLGLAAGMSGGHINVIALTEDGRTIHEIDGDEVVVFTDVDVPVPAVGGAPHAVELTDFERPWVDEQ